MITLTRSNNTAPPKKLGKSNEWYTPHRYIEAAREVMGSIDLDPASCYEANQTVRATRYYTQQDNGLNLSWYGNVWCNPPFTTQDREKDGTWKSCIGLFTAKAIHEYKAGNVKQCILLSIPSIDTRWFQPLWEYPICFTNHRVHFNGVKLNPKTSNTPLGGTIFVYLGANEARFIDVFSQFGRIAKAVDVPIAKPRQLELVS